MKTLTAGMSGALATLEGTEPIVIIGVTWDGTNETLYADRAFDSVEGRVISLGQLESVATENSTSQSMTIVLDDTDGELKEVFDTKDFQKIPCNVYQHINGLTLSDKLLLLKGQISTPVVWNEKDRTVSITVVSEIESYEVGFSPEEGQLDFVTTENVGKPWPLCFGTPIHVKAAKVGKSAEGGITGTLAEDYCVIDIMLDVKLKNLANAWSQQRSLVTMWIMVGEGAKKLAPAPGLIIDKLIRNIRRGRFLTVELTRILEKIDSIKDLIKRGFAVQQELAVAEAALDQISAIMHRNQVELDEIRGLIELAEFAYNVRKQADNAAIQAFGAANQIYAEYLTVLQEKCRQGKCSPETVVINGGDKFPQGEVTDIYINDVRFRGMFMDELFTFIAGPLPTYKNLEVDTWVENDDPCEPEDEHNGISTFYLKKREKITNHHALVRKVDGSYHVIKIVRQEGRRVIFELVQWANTGGGQPRGISIDEQLGRLYNVPFIQANPLPGGILGQLNFLFNRGNLAIDIWNQPESKRLKAIIIALGGVTEEEFRMLGKLVYLDEHYSEGPLVLVQPGPRDIFTIIGPDVAHVLETSPVPLKHWYTNYTIPEEEWPESAFWKADVGTTVGQTAKDCIVYIANILPSTIKSVNAYRTLPNGKRVLAAVPSDYYVKNESANLGTIDVTALTFPVALANMDEGWEDDLYVTLTSSVGPNVCDIIQHLVETYTNASVNASNFAAIKAKFVSGSDELYPANFALYDRPNVLDEINRIAFEARCSVYRVNGEFFLKYLSEEPAHDVTFTLEDFDNVDHYSISYSDTDNLVTRLVANWNPDYLPLEDGKKPYNVTLRHNVKRYGLQTEEIDFHIYNNEELVLKSATFWLIRKANTWKQVSFTTFLKHLRLDVWDTVKLSMFDNVKSVVQGITYNTESNSLNMTVELPVKAGETAFYPYYWPALLPANTLFPTTIEIEKGYAGGYGPGSGVKGTINDCDT